jgi:O-antigen/teichoic acid export membrane protein
VCNCVDASQVDLATDVVIERQADGLASPLKISTTDIAEPTLGRNLSRFRRFLLAATKGGLAVLGQGLFAGANFVANVLLARWLPPEQYGAFALAYSCFLLFLTLYSACIYEPLIVFGSGRYANRFHDYFPLLIRGNVFVLVGLSCLMLITSIVLGLLYPRGVTQDFMALSLAGPFVLITWLGRGAFYARLKPGEAALGASIYFFILLSVLVCLRVKGRLSGNMTILGMGVAGLVSSVFMFSRLGFKLKNPPTYLGLGEVVSDHWNYGRWALATAAVAWFPDNIYYAILPARAGLEGTAALRALVNLFNPVLHTQMALSAVLIPTLVRRRQRLGIPGMVRTLRILLGVMILAAAAYLAVFWWLRPMLFEFLYEGKYRGYSGLPALLIGLLTVITGAAIVLGSALRAIECPKSIFWSYATAGTTALILGLPLAINFGVIGAAVGMLASSTMTTVGLALLLYRRTQEARLAT